MSKSKNVFITGCNRGVGFGLVKQILEKIKPENLFATCRDPNNAKDLSALAEKYSNLHIIQLDVTKTETYGDVVAKVEKITGDNGLNLLINNAAVLTKPSADSIFDLDKEDLNFHMQVNAIAPVLLIKAFMPLLEKSSVFGKSTPGGISKCTIMNITTKVASIEDNTSGGMYCYRSSKTALNMLTKCISLELKSKGIVTVLIHPGWVQTEMGGNSAPLSVEASVSGIVKVLENLSETDNGRFFQFDGKEIPW